MSIRVSNVLCFNLSVETPFIIKILKIKVSADSAHLEVLQSRDLSFVYHLVFIYHGQDIH